MYLSWRLAITCCLCVVVACQRTRGSESPNPHPRAALADASTESKAPAENSAAVPQVLLTTAPEAEAAPSRSAASPAATELPSAAGDPTTAYRVLVMGDSLSDYRSGGGKFIRYLQERCPESRFDNVAKGGEMVNQMRRRLETLLRDDTQRYSHVLVYGGVNDLYSDLTASRTNERIQSDLLAMYELARARGAQVIALTVSPWGGFTRYFNRRRGDNTLALNAWISSLEGGAVDRVIDTHPLLRCGDADRLCPNYHAPFTDGLHIGPEGHRVLGQQLYERVFGKCR